MIMNMMCASKANPRISAYMNIFGEFDYNNMQLVPPETKLVKKVNPGKRASWAPHRII